MSKLLVVVAIALVVLGGFFLFSGSDTNSSSDVIDNSNSGASNLIADPIIDPVDTSGDGESMEDEEEVKTFVVTGENFKFVMNGLNNPDLKVKQGDTVRIEFTSAGGLHDWVVDEFDASTKRVNTGGSTFVEFVADKTGNFEYYCSVGSHRAQGMKGMLIVE